MDYDSPRVDLKLPHDHIMNVQWQESCCSKPIEFLLEASFGPRVLSLYYPSLYPRVSLCVCVCVCLCASTPSYTEFGRTINHHLFKLWSPTWDQRCKTPRLKSLLFLLCVWCLCVRLLTLSLKFNPKVRFTPFQACPHHNSLPFQALNDAFANETLA